MHRPPMDLNNQPQNASDQDYDVGYGKPPKHSQFKPGQSGNPNGRPNGSKSLSTLLRKALNERIEVNKGGKRLKRSKLDNAIEQLVNKAAGGDIKAFTSTVPAFNTPRRCRSSQAGQIRTFAGN